MKGKALEVDVVVRCKQKSIEIVVYSCVKLFVEVILLGVLETNENRLLFISSDHIYLVVLLDKEIVTSYCPSKLIFSPPSSSVIFPFIMNFIIGLSLTTSRQ